MLDAIRTIHAGGGVIATICVAARPVAAAGLLAGEEATTYPLDGGKHLCYLAEHGAAVVDRDVVVSDRLLLRPNRTGLKEPVLDLLPSPVATVFCTSTACSTAVRPKTRTSLSSNSDRIITSTGPATGFAVAFWLLEMLDGSEGVEKVRGLGCSHNTTADRERNGKKNQAPQVYGCDKYC